MGPFRDTVLSKWSQMGRVEGDWAIAASGFRSILSCSSVDGHFPLTGFALGGGGGGAAGDKSLCRRGANGTGGGRPLGRSLGIVGGGRAGCGFLGSGLVGFLCRGVADGALVKTGLEF